MLNSRTGYRIDSAAFAPIEYRVSQRSPGPPAFGIATVESAGSV